MRHINLLIIVLFLVTSCNGQEKGKISKEELQELYKREKKNEERAKYGGENSKIEVVTNPEKVEKLKSYISEKNSEKNKKELEANKNKSLSERYKSGDKTVIPFIIETLNSNDTDKKKELYRNLSRRYDEPEDYSIIEPELTKAILKNISISEDEKSVIQLAGFMKLEGYPEVFEERLLSGKSQDDNRLIYWLGADGKSQKTLQYIEKLLSANKFDFEENDYVMSGLEGFAENGNAEIKNKTLDICLDIYNRKLIPKERFDEMKTSWSSSNPAIDLTEILLESGDVRVIPIAKQFVQNEVRAEKALAALINLEGDTHRDLVFELLENKDKFFDALYPASELYKLSKDKEIVETILKQFEKRGEYQDYLIDRVVSTLIKMDATEYFSNLDNTLKNQELINSLVKNYNLTKVSIETVAKDLYELGVVDEPISQKAIDKAKKLSNNEETGGFVYDLLTASELHQWFDAETGTLPVDYDNLILEFSKNSNGKLKDIEVWMDADVDKNYNVEYKIFVSANNRIYIMAPEDIGDWYDVEMTLNLMNTIAKDANLDERYVFIDTGDQTVQTLFGPIKNVTEFIEKYNL
ncbi:MAG: hypothetical protein ABJL43_01145 [Maribacter dokdonensis]|uniref:hypothetical protein n=1 Tax=Maribacter dokdonensis TaxID=320912 RepID=UPI00329A0C83